MQSSYMTKAHYWGIAKKKGKDDLGQIMTSSAKDVKKKKRETRNPGNWINRVLIIQMSLGRTSKPSFHPRAGSALPMSVPTDVCK